MRTTHQLPLDRSLCHSSHSLTDNRTNEHPLTNRTVSGARRTLAHSLTHSKTHEDSLTHSLTHSATLVNTLTHSHRWMAREGGLAKARRLTTRERRHKTTVLQLIHPPTHSRTHRTRSLDLLPHVVLFAGIVIAVSILFPHFFI